MSIFYRPLVAALMALLIILGIALTSWQTTQTIWFPTHISADTTFHPHKHIAIEALPRYHLMGAAVQNVKDLPLASLGVTLIGIFSDSSGQSTALITLSGGNSQNYHVGDQLAANVVVEKILAKSVIVKHNGRLEKLQLPIQPIDFDNQKSQAGLWND